MTQRFLFPQQKCVECVVYMYVCVCDCVCAMCGGLGLHCEKFQSILGSN